MSELSRKDFMRRFTVAPFSEEYKAAALATARDPKRQQEYEAQISKMQANGRRWLAENPRAEVSVAYHYEPGILVVAAISEAFDNKFISANEDGLKLIKALWPWGEPEEPTILMVRVVLESLL
jgi:hypothetical protein